MSSKVRPLIAASFDNTSWRWWNTDCSSVRYTGWHLRQLIWPSLLHHIFQAINFSGLENVLIEGGSRFFSLDSPEDGQICSRLYEGDTQSHPAMFKAWKRPDCRTLQYQTWTRKQHSGPHLLSPGQWLDLIYRPVGSVFPACVAHLTSLSASGHSKFISWWCLSWHELE